MRSCHHHRELVTLPEAARATGWPLRTLQHWAKRGKLPRTRDDAGRTRYELGTIRAEVARARLRLALRPAGATPDPAAGDRPQTATPDPRGSNQ